MTPKEKAVEIFNKMCNEVDELLPLDVKECALIAVDEIIKEKQECHKFECYGNDIEYWQQVKIEIVQL